MKLKARQLRKSTPRPEDYLKIKRNPIYLVLDNVLDTYNIGSLFRLADAIAAEKLFICGASEYPPSSKIHKSAVGTEAWVNWSKAKSAQNIIASLKTKGVQIIAVEQGKKATDYRRLITEMVRFPCAIVVGHETRGVSKAVLKQADLIIEIPMFGINHSFNVWGSAAVVAYKIIEFLQSKGK